MNTYFDNDSHFKKSAACSRFYRCVSVAISPENDVAVRRSGDPGKATIVFSEDEWNTFIEGVKKGEFDLH